MEINFGSCGNVFAYNFCYDSSSYGVVGCSIDSNHGPHSSYNLYEGNIAPNIQSDGYFGSASDDTVFRNWFFGTAPGVTTVVNGSTVLAAREPVLLQRFTRNYNVIGNAGTQGCAQSISGAQVLGGCPIVRLAAIVGPRPSSREPPSPAPAVIGRTGTWSGR